MLEQVVEAVGLALVNSGEASLLLDALSGSSVGAPSPAPWTHVVSAAALVDLGRVTDARGELELARAQSGPGFASASDFEEIWSAVDRQLRRRRGLHAETTTDWRTEAPRATSPDVQVYAAVERGGALLGAGDPAAATFVLDSAVDLAEALGRPAALLDALVLLALTRAPVRTTAALVPTWTARSRSHASTGGAPRRDSRTPTCSGPGVPGSGWRTASPAGTPPGHERSWTGPSDPSVTASVRLLDEVIAFEADPLAFAAAGEVHRVWESVEGRRTPALVVHAALVDARFSLLLHRIERVHETAEALRRSVGECGELTLIDALLETANGRHRQALERVRKVSGRQVEVVTPVSLLIAAALETRLAVLEDDTYAATRAARQALELADRFDAPRAIVDFGAEQMLLLLQTERGRWGTHEALAERIAGTARQHPDSSPEVLTTRELEVLVELPTLRTVDEIAHSMYVSSNTLKTHLRSVYRKLGVSSRRDAITAARQRGLL